MFINKLINAPSKFHVLIWHEIENSFSIATFMYDRCTRSNGSFCFLFCSTCYCEWLVDHQGTGPIGLSNKSTLAFWWLN